MATAKEIWDTLSKIDVSKHIEKKGNLSYLSWAWAWGELMNHYPDAAYAFSDFTDGAGVVRDALYYPDGTASVECAIRIGDVAHEMWLPVMDNRNNAIANPTARQISDTKMRCLVKCIAMFGLGHYIYAGEDLPGNAEPTPKPKSAAKLKREDAWPTAIAEIDKATDPTHLKAIMVEIAPTLKEWPENWKAELREYCDKVKAELEVPENLLAAG